jgi:hypothetical protein
MPKLLELQKWLDQWRTRLNRTSYPHLFHPLLKQFWDTLKKTPETFALLERVRNGDANHSSPAADILINHLNGNTQVFDGHFTMPETERDHIKMSYVTLSSMFDTTPELEKENLEEFDTLSIGRIIERKAIALDGSRPLRPQQREALSSFMDVIVEPLILHLESKLETRSSMLALLKHYKSKVELFNRKDLTARMDENPKNAERSAKLHLFEYLHDNRLVYFVEPKIGADEPDLIACQETDDPLIADAKVFTKEKTAITRGFHQVYRYTQDYHASVGYLIVYNRGDRPILIHGDGEEANIQYVCLPSGVMIFFVIIETMPNPKSASQLLRHDPIVVNRDDITTAIYAKPEQAE